jgi:hypothetical protein
MNIHVVMISSGRAKPFSLPLGTVLLRVGDGSGHVDWSALYGSFCDLVGDEGREGVAFQTYSSGTVLMYGNAKCPLLTRISQLGSALVSWCERMGVRAARAAVLCFTPFIPILPEAPFWNLEMAACGLVNQTLDSAGVLMEKGDTMEGKCLIIVGGPPPSWFAGLGITSTTMQTFGRRQS